MAVTDHKPDGTWAIGNKGGPSNQPTIDLWSALAPDALQAFIDERFQRHVRKRDELLAGFKRFLMATASGIHDEVIAGKATDFDRQLRAAVKDAEETRVAVKEPVLLAQRQIDAAGRAIAEPLVDAAKQVTARITTYLVDVDRKVREAAQQEAQEAAARALAALDQATVANDPETIQHALEAASKAAEEAAVAEAVVEAKPADLTRVRTQLGSTSSLRYEWVYEITDPELIPRNLMMPNDPAIKLAIRQGLREAAGLRIYQKPKATVR